MSGYTHSNFGWKPNSGLGGSSFGGSTLITNNLLIQDNKTISYQTGQTYISQNSVITENLTAESISSLDSEPVLFPDGISGDPIYYDNAYEKTALAGNTHHNKVYFEDEVACADVLKVDSIVPNLEGEITITGDVSISGNLNVVGSTTSISSVNTNYADRHLLLNNGYQTAAALSSGLIANRLPGTSYALSGDFTADTVGTVAASGLVAGDYIQISGSTSNDGIFQVVSHAANLLTIEVVDPDEAFLQNSWNVEVAAGVAQIVHLSGLEFSAAGTGLNYLNGNSVSSQTRLAIAHDTSSPSFNALEADTVDISGTVVLDDSITSVLVLDGTRIKKRTAASLVSSLTSSSGTILPELTGCGIVAETYGHVAYHIDFSGEIQTHNIGPFTATVITPGPAIFMPMGTTDNVSSLNINFPIMLYFDGAFEECLLIHDSSEIQLVLCRKDSSNFPAGVISHAVENFAGFGEPLRTSYTFVKY